MVFRLILIFVAMNSLHSLAERFMLNGKPPLGNKLEKECKIGEELYLTR